MQNQNSKCKVELRERAYKYAIRMIKFLDGLENSKTSGVIINQLTRSATSVGANLVEAKGASSRKDFTNFVCHSLKSANESLFLAGFIKRC